jgi:hypothetical protein
LEALRAASVGVVAILVGMAVLLPMAALAGPGGPRSLPCDPYPVGYCPQADREVAIFCYVREGPRMVSATVPATILLGAPDEKATGALYVRENAAGVPEVWAENNHAPGLQPQASTCAQFMAYDFGSGILSWTGPFAPIASYPDVRPQERPAQAALAVALGAGTKAFHLASPATEAVAPYAAEVYAQAWRLPQDVWALEAAALQPLHDAWRDLDPGWGSIPPGPLPT